MESDGDNYLKRMDPRKDLMIGLLATWSRVTLHQMHCLGFLAFSGQEKHGNCGHEKLLGCSGDQPPTFCLGCFFDGLFIPFFNKERVKLPKSQGQHRESHWGKLFETFVWPDKSPSSSFSLDKYIYEKVKPNFKVKRWRLTPPTTLKPIH